MPPIALLALEIVFAFVALTTLAVTIQPWLRRLHRLHALQALLWLHVGRFAPLALLAPGQTDPAVPLSVTRTIAWGDFTAAVFALIAIIALRSRGARGMVWVWVFSAISSIDIVTALAVGLGFGVQDHALGVGWYVLTMYVPVVCVAQWMIGTALLRPSAFAARREIA